MQILLIHQKKMGVIILREEINFVKIMEIILRLWWLVLVFAVIGGLVGFSASTFLMAPKYTSVAKVYVDGSQRSDNSGVNMNDLTTNARLVSTYIEILCSDTYMNQIATKAKEENSKYNLSGADIKRDITMGSANETEILEIKYSDISPERARDVLQILLDNAQSEITRIVPGCRVNIVDRANLPTTTSSPNTKQNTFIAIFIGVVFGVAVILIKEILDNRIKDEDDLKNKYNIPVLGIIPNLDVD